MVLRGGERITFALVLAVLNLIALMFGGKYVIIPSGIIIWVISFVAGYISGKSGDAGIIIVEPLSLTVIGVLRSGFWSSLNYIAQTLGVIVVIYFLGVAGGLTFKSTGISFQAFKPSIKDMRATLPPFLGALGINLITLSAYLIINETLNLTLPLPSSLGMKLLLALGVLTSYIASISFSRRGLKYRANTLISGLISIPSAITLPVVVALRPEKASLPQLPKNWIPVGEVKEVFRKGSTLIGKTVYLKTKLGVNNHLVIVGATGTGKTYFIRNIIKPLKGLNINAVILDFHGEYSDLSDIIIHPRVERINMLNLLDSDPRSRAEELADEIARNYRLGNLQKAALYELLIKAYEKFGANLTPRNLEYLLRDEDFVNELSLNREVIKSLLPYVKALGSEKVRWINLTTLLNKVVSVNLSEINSLPLQQLIAESVIDSIYYLRRNNPGITFLVIEEAHRLSGKRGPAGILRVFREGRKFGIFTVAVFQDLGQIDPGILNNASHIIAFRISDESFRNRVLKLVLNSLGHKGKLMPKISRFLTTLEVGEAIAKIYDGLYLVLSSPRP